MDDACSGDVHFVVLLTDGSEEMRLPEVRKMLAHLGYVEKALYSRKVYSFGVV